MADFNLKYGSYTHAVAEPAVLVRKELIEDDKGAAIGHSVTWEINGRLVAASQAALFTAMEDLENAYSVNNKNISFETTDGTVIHQIKLAQTGQGIKIASFVWPMGQDAVLATFADYQIMVKAEVALVGSGPGGNSLLSFQEAISIVGTGGPRRVVREMLNGPPIEQIVSSFTLGRATQSGTATGWNSYPNPGIVIFPAYLINPDSAVTRSRAGTRLQTAWSYQFVSPGGFSF